MPIPAGGGTPDLLATIDDLAAKLQVQVSDLDQNSALLALQGATAVIQAAVRQRLLRVESESITLFGSSDRLLTLPERPVTSVTSVSLDGTALSAGTVSGNYRIVGDRLYRPLGWLGADWCSPAPITVVYTHGYDLDDQRLQLARGFAATLAAGAYEQPGGGAVSREQIDDYSVAYAASAGMLSGSTAMQTMLRRAYGLRAAMVAVI